MSESKKTSASLALGAMFLAIVSVPVTAFINIFLGICLLAAPIFMIYKAS